MAGNCCDNRLLDSVDVEELAELIPDHTRALEAIHEGHVAVHQDQGVGRWDELGIELLQLLCLLDERALVALDVLSDQVEGLLTVKAVVNGVDTDIKLVHQNRLQSLDVEDLVIHDQDLLGCRLSVRRGFCYSNLWQDVPRFDSVVVSYVVFRQLEHQLVGSGRSVFVLAPFRLLGKVVFCEIEIFKLEGVSSFFKCLIVENECFRVELVGAQDLLLFSHNDLVRLFRLELEGEEECCAVVLFWKWNRVESNRPSEFLDNPF